MARPVRFAPFTNTYVSKVGACEPTFAVVFNREEAAPQIITIDDFSPPNPSGTPGPTICWEATSVNFNNPDLASSRMSSARRTRTR